MSLDNLIDGRAIAKEVHAETEARVAALKADGVEPSLVFIRVGEDPASRVYVGMKERTAARLGIRSETTVLPEDTSESELLELLGKLNADNSVHGVLVQAPLPLHIDETRVFSAVSPGKDIDGFHPLNVGKLMLGEGGGFVPCTPGGVHELLIRSDVSIEAAEVVILGRGNIVGKPMAQLLLQQSCTVTIAHSRTKDLPGIVRLADIVVAAVGRPEMVRGDWIKPGATVIDVGINRVAGAEPGKTKLVGDCAYDECAAVAGAITPVPGGVGPMTIACLLRNTLVAAHRRAGLGNPEGL